ncbi:MAG TPA: hypothetical protein VGW75_05300 [Solirubrobacteraceae bacterium]|jgi:hypothetical protein|nr:hypothetical protein [Solirubrobacteraceae bacterium]
MPDDPGTRLSLSLRLEGPLVEDHRLPLSELQRIATQLRSTLRSIAVVLTDSGPSGRGGRVRSFIEESVDLRVVGAPTGGSFGLELETPPASPSGQPELLDRMGPRLAERSVHALVSGLDLLDDETVQLPDGFDRGVLRAVGGFGQTLRRGVTRLVLTAEAADGGAERIVALDREKIELTKRLIGRPIRSHAVVEGRLEMVDDRTLECRVERPGAPAVSCFFDETERDAVWDAGKGRKHVRVSGDGEFLPHETEPRRIDATRITVTHEELPFDPDVFWADKPLDRLATEQDVAAHALTGPDDDWRDDDEVAAFLAAIHEEH